MAAYLCRFCRLSDSVHGAAFEETRPAEKSTEFCSQATAGRLRSFAGEVVWSKTGLSSTLTQHVLYQRVTRTLDEWRTILHDFPDSSLGCRAYYSLVAVFTDPGRARQQAVEVVLGQGVEATSESSSNGFSLQKGSTFDAADHRTGKVRHGTQRRNDEDASVAGTHAAMRVRKALAGDLESAQATARAAAGRRRRFCAGLGSGRNQLAVGRGGKPRIQRASRSRWNESARVNTACANRARDQDPRGTIEPLHFPTPRCASNASAKQSVPATPAARPATGDASWTRRRAMRSCRSMTLSWTFRNATRLELRQPNAPQ